ncbi:hypothetical protein FNO01nite_20580 [Flavobacterium noncentrifugens]|uniref:HNH endonuclease n=1 Tax=Flavobacterium noncentrifugens TaxID=1128970 RepID=A0A1G8YWM7_9FLAO|nr:NUMOD4 domain-containing protein [Flavobacterium noncentrifugens]GEP51386.1 hypothetical protein FNO01nite_20580 [Flavobacterium noncentrifugens]SDK07191.1 HNH endonuclease [Flavobacterium noncentrifugens]
MLRFKTSETFREIVIDAPLKMRYAVSNYGRLISYTQTFEDGRELSGGRADGYRTLHYKIRDGESEKKKNKYIFLYRAVAEFFIPKTSDEQVYVLHLDRKRDNDHISNLRWATRAEMLEHSRTSPYVIAAKTRKVLGNGKLTSTQVIRLKKRLQDPKRKTRLRILAKEFGISEMQLRRIKTGENWGHIVV